MTNQQYKPVDYRPIAIATLLELIDTYPAAPSDPERMNSMSEKWAREFQTERLTDKQIKRGLYWAARDERHGLCSIGQFLKWTKDKTPMEYEQDYMQQKNQLRHQQPKYIDQEVMKKKIKELQASLAAGKKFND